MLLNGVAIIAYFITREYNAGWIDLPIISSLLATGSAVLITAAVLGQFAYDKGGNQIVYAGLGAFYALITVVMFLYWLITTSETVYNKTIGRTL